MTSTALVVKVGLLAAQETLGSHSTAPRWAAAWKFPAREIPAVIRRITIQTGRSGILAPVAELEPVHLDGTTISRATLHNRDFIVSRDIREGDTVGLQRAGDVIPQILSVDLSRRPGNSRPWIFPDHCPACGSPVLEVPGKAALRCSLGQACGDQKVGYLAYFSGKKAFDFEGTSQGRILDLVAGGFLDQPSDFFLLWKRGDDLSKRKGWGSSSVKNLLDSIEDKKHIPLDRFLRAFGIDGLGSSHCRRLAREYLTWEVFLATMQEIVSGDETALNRIHTKVEGMGETRVRNLRNFFQEEANTNSALRMLELGVVPLPVEVPQADTSRKRKDNPTMTSSRFASKTLVFTGKLALGSRDDASALAEQAGARTSSSVTTRTDFLVVGEKPGSKLKKAQSLNIPVIPEAEFLAGLE